MVSHSRVVVPAHAGTTSRQLRDHDGTFFGDCSIFSLAECPEAGYTSN